MTALQPGRSKAAESEPVQPVPMEVVTQTIPHLTSVVGAMVRLQLLTGARPGEVIGMKPTGLGDRSDEVWVYQPSSHKTSHRGKRRVLHLGPEAQEILIPFLLRDNDAFCFSPAEALQESIEKRSSQTGKGGKPSVRKGISASYNKDTYNRAISRACELAFEMPKELRRISPSLPDEEKARLRALAKEWRAEHC